MNAMDTVIKRAQEAGKRIVLPEGTEPRVIAAAAQVVAKKIALPILLGNEAKIQELAAKDHVNLDGVKIVDPETTPKRKEYADLLYELRKKKGMTPEQAYEIAADPLYTGVLMVKAGDADGEVSGSVHSSSDTIRPALQVLKTAPNVSLVSAFFVMIVPDCEYGADGLFIYADSGLNINPNAEQLGEIAITSADSMKSLFGIEPYVAMLSFSTKGSAKDPLADKVIEATKYAQAKRPDLKLDGEMQADAAIVDWVGKSKAPGSPVAGHANVLIFPDLSCGNICYKITQRLAKAEAYGPILQGIAHPVNDLSRGCSASDIVNVVAITAVQAID